MATSLSVSSFTIGRYKTIKDILSNPIDVSKLPIVGESKIFKQSAGRYGHVILKLDLEKGDDTMHYSRERFSYAWEVEDDYTPVHEGTYSILPISKVYFEAEIVKELKFFIGLFSFLNDNETPLRFSVIGGSYKNDERPYFAAVTVEAIIEIFKQLLDSK